MVLEASVEPPAPPADRLIPGAAHANGAPPSLPGPNVGNPLDGRTRGPDGLAAPGGDDARVTGSPIND